MVRFLDFNSLKLARILTFNMPEFKEWLFGSPAHQGVMQKTFSLFSFMHEWILVGIHTVNKDPVFKQLFLDNWSVGNGLKNGQMWPF